MGTEPMNNMKPKWTLDQPLPLLRIVIAADHSSIFGKIAMMKMKKRMKIRKKRGRSMRLRNLMKMDMNKKETKHMMK